ncbi:unnamed protein product [Closterium sp. NIES-53]
MSPQNLMHTGCSGTQADLWSLGVLLFLLSSAGCPSTIPYTLLYPSPPPHPPAPPASPTPLNPPAPPPSRSQESPFQTQ